MSLCRLMINDFQHGDGEDYEKYPIGFDDYDLNCGISWARELLNLGFECDDWYGLNLRNFVKWCQHKGKVTTNLRHNVLF